MDSYTLTSRRKFISIFVFFTIGLVFFWTLGIIGNHISPVSSQIADRVNQSTPSISDARIITLGTSHNRAILTENFSYPLLHLYTGSQNFEESLFLLKYFRSRLKSLKLVLIPITIGSIAQTSEIRPQIYAELISLENTDFFINSIPFGFDIYLSGWLSQIARPDNWASVAYIYFNGKPNEDKKEEEKIIEVNPFKQDRAILHISNSISNDNIQKNINIEILNNITAITQELDACIVLYESPVSHIYLNNFEKYKPELKDWKANFINFVNQSNSCVYFIENIWPLENSNNPSYYSDQDHLNEKGSILFTKLINEKIRYIEKNLIKSITSVSTTDAETARDSY